MKFKGLERLDVVSLFPAMFDGPLSESLIGKARERKLIDIRVHNLRDYSDDRKHRKVDDRPYGGGPGMVIRAEPVYRALKAIRARRTETPAAACYFRIPARAVADAKHSAGIGREALAHCGVRPLRRRG